MRLVRNGLTLLAVLLRICGSLTVEEKGNNRVSPIVSAEIRYISVPRVR